MTSNRPLRGFVIGPPFSDSRWGAVVHCHVQRRYGGTQRHGGVSNWRVARGVQVRPGAKRLLVQSGVFPDRPTYDTVLCTPVVRYVPCAHTYLHTYLQTYLHTYLYTYTYAYTYTYICLHITTYTYTPTFMSRMVCASCMLCILCTCTRAICW